jgi:hypothetical protein
MESAAAQNWRNREKWPISMTQVPIREVGVNVSSPSRKWKRTHHDRVIELAVANVLKMWSAYLFHRSGHEYPTNSLFSNLILRNV